MMTQQTEPGWFRLRTVNFSQLDELENCLEDFARRALDGVLIREVYPADYMQEISARIERHEPPFYIFPPLGQPSEVRKFRHLYGITLVAAAQDLNQYFDVAESFRTHCRQLFSDDVDFEERISRIFETCSGGRSVALPHTVDGRIYMPATIRILPEGSGIDLHCDNTLSHHPTYAHLKTVCDVSNQLAYFLTINTPHEGGELIVYERRWAQEDDTATQYVMQKNASMVEGCDWVTLKPQPGDMILFAGGRHYHRVTESVGPRPRHTIGGFITNALEGDALYYWS
ncbi:MAG TPA: 2OG-Fe(II) oxygenase [Pyrinomonadaceae bacterium]|jgi:hypothetical protein